MLMSKKQKVHPLYHLRSKKQIYEPIYIETWVDQEFLKNILPEVFLLI